MPELTNNSENYLGISVKDVRSTGKWGLPIVDIEGRRFFRRGHVRTYCCKNFAVYP